MEILSESKKILLAKLKFRDTRKYKEKLSLFEISESELVDYIQKEEARIKSIEPIKVAPKKDNTMSGYVYYMGNSPYWSYEVPLLKVSSNNSARNNTKARKKILIMVDGDNHPYTALKGWENVLYKADVTIYVANEYLQKRIDEKVRGQIPTTLVKNGPQAVDNRIKTELGKEAKKHAYSKLVIVSHGQGYREKIKEWKQKAGWSDDKIILCKYISNALN